MPKSILVNNVKTIIDTPRTLYKKYIVNHKFSAFAKDFGFNVVTCVSRTPKTKGKIESTMKILDKILKYNRTLRFMQECQAKCVDYFV